MDRKGINPIISAILLILITMSIGGLYWNWVQNYYQTQISKQSAVSGEQIECTEAGFQINSCSFDEGDTNVATIQLENTGYVDLNKFTVVVKYSSGESDQNINSINLDEGEYGLAYIQLDAGKNPHTVKVTSRDCKNLEDSTQNCT